MTDTTLDDEPHERFWWSHEDGAAIVRQVWAAVEDAFVIGCDVSVRLSKPGQPKLTIAFDRDAPEDADGALI